MMWEISFCVTVSILQKTAYEIIAGDWSSDVCSSDLTSAPHIISVGFAGIRSEVLLHALEEKGIYVSVSYTHLLRSRSYIRRQMYADLKRQMKVLTAEKIYQFLDAQGLKEAELERLEVSPATGFPWR